MIKKQRNKLLTLLVAGAIGTAALGGAALLDGVKVDAAETYSMTTVFSYQSATLKKDGDGETGAFKMEIKDAGKVSYTRDLALKWYEKDTTVSAKYMNMVDHVELVADIVCSHIDIHTLYEFKSDERDVLL